MMMIESIVFILLTVQSVILLYPMHYFLTPKYSGRISALLWVIPVLTIPTIRLIVLVDGDSLTRVLIMLATWAVVLTIGYSDIWWKRVLAACTCLLNTIVGETILFLGITLFFPKYLENAYSMDIDRAIIYVLGTLIYFMIGCGEIYAWKKIYLKSSMKGIGVLCLLPITQYLLQMSIESSFWNGEGNNEGILWLYMAHICFFIVDIIWFMWIVWQNQRSTVEQELEDIRYEMERSKVYYQELEDKREYVAHIRHDYNNQLYTIRNLLETEPDAAKIMIEEMILVLQREAGMGGAET